MLQVASSVVAIYLATSNPSYAVEEDYYRKAVEWDKRRAQDRRNAELGWQLSFDAAAPGSAGEHAQLSAILSDAGGFPVNGANITVEAFHNALADRILRGQFEPLGDGRYRTSLPMRRSGVWELRFVAERGGDRFTHTEVRHLILDRR